MPGRKLDLEKEFSPSMWSKRFENRDDVLIHHIKHVESESKEVLNNLKYELDIPYGESDAEKYDILGTDLPDDAPILAFVHGGYWQELSRQQSRYPAGPLYKAGIKTIIIGYDLCPKVSLGTIVKEVEIAVQAVVQYAEMKISRGLFLAGHSAGAHLISKVLGNKNCISSIINNKIFHGAILISGVYDLTGIVETSVNDPLHLSIEEAKSLSPHYDSYFHLKSSSFRTYILVGENDSFTFRSQSRDFYNMLMESGDEKNVNFEIKNNLDHFDIVEIVTKDENYLKNIILNDLMKYACL